MHASTLAWVVRAGARTAALPTACAVVVAIAACGDEEASTAQGPTDDPRTGDHADRAAALQSADLGAVLDALAQDHAIARATIGAHRMSIDAELTLAPQGEPATAEPTVGHPRPVADAVHDEIELVWGSAAGQPPRFSLAQHNDHDHGRDVVVADERMYTRHEHRSWYVQPLQADVWELWLDEAQQSVSDVIALAAPRLHVAATARPGEGLAGGDAIAMQLSLADGVDPARADIDGLRAWRKDVEITAVAGEVVVDARSGLWLAADVRVSYTMPGPDGRPLRGEAHVNGTVVPLTPDKATIAVPEQVTPLLERTRYEVERARLLDGLAGR